VLNFDTQLELRVLRTLLDKQDPDLLKTLSIDWFGYGETREIFSRVMLLKQKGKPVPSCEILAGDPTMRDTSKQILAEMSVPYIAPAEIPSVIEQLDYYRQGRVLFQLAQSVSEGLKVSEPKLDQVKQEIRNYLGKLEDSSLQDEMLSYTSGNMDNVFEQYSNLLSQTVAERYIPTGFNNIDSQQGGFGRGRVYAIGAPSGCGKSTFANQAAVNTYIGGFSACYCTFEMDTDECMLRTQAFISRLPSERFNLFKLTPEDRKHSDKTLARFLNRGTDNRLDYFCPKRDLNISQLFTILEPLNYDVIVIDYINLMSQLDPKKGLWENIGEAFRIAKQFAIRNDCAVLMLVQTDEETGKVKYAKSIKHHSDGLWLWTPNEQERETGVYTFMQEKLRNFKPTSFSMRAEFEFCCFSESFGAGAPAPAPVVPGVKPMKLR
jgi:replicative DNA helicase